jgi:hypothetical protein
MLANENPVHPDEQASNIAKRKVLDYLANAWNISNAAKSAGIRRITVYGWIEEDPEFRREYQDLLDGHIDGAEENIIDQGEHNKKAFVPAIFMLKSHRPEIYDRQALAGRMLGNVTINIGQVSSDTLKGLDLTGKARIAVDDVPSIDSGKDSTA